jgi:hypothetical protein
MKKRIIIILLIVVVVAFTTQSRFGSAEFGSGVFCARRSNAYKLCCIE